MKIQAKSNLQMSLQSLGITFLLIFSMAFACNEEKSGGNTNREERTTSRSSCSTKEEFTKLIKRDRLKTLQSRDNLREPEIIINSLNVAAPITYSPVYNGKVVKVSPAYPVTVNWTQRTFMFGKISEGDFEGGLFYCYRNPEDYASKFTPDDERYPKNACVCIAQNPEAVTAAKSRECKYEQGQAETDCSE